MNGVGRDGPDAVSYPDPDASDDDRNACDDREPFERIPEVDTLRRLAFDDARGGGDWTDEDTCRCREDWEGLFEALGRVTGEGARPAESPSA